MMLNRAPLPEGWTTKNIDGLIYTYDENGRGVCGAYNEKRGTYDRSSPCRGSNRCAHHGGKAIRGRRGRIITRPQFIDRFIEDVRNE